MRPLRTVHRLLEECGGLAMLKDPHMTTATAEIVAGERPRHEVQRDIKAKERARAQLARKWVPHLPFSIEDAIARATQVQTPPPPPPSLPFICLPVSNGHPSGQWSTAQQVSWILCSPFHPFRHTHSLCLHHSLQPQQAPLWQKLHLAVVLILESILCQVADTYQSSSN